MAARVLLLGNSDAFILVSSFT